MPQFLQTSFLAGLAALAVPVLIHLFFRLKTRRVDLGTIRFLRIALEETARRRKVMRWMLLALRMTVVALLVALFARPFLSAAATGGDKELLVILIDQSATMQLKGESGRLIDQAVAEAKRLVETAGNQARFEVAFFDDNVHPLSIDSDGAGVTGQAVMGRLQAPPALFGATSYGAAFAWARDICVKAPSGRRQFHLFTDLQRSGLDWTEVELLPAGVESHLHDLGRPVVNNVAVTEIRTPRLWVRPGESPTIHASILYSGAFALEEVAIAFEIGRVDSSGQRLADDAKRPVPRRTEFAKLAERITKRERVKLEPGATVTLDFELPALSEGLWQGRVTVEYDDDLPFDNQRYFAFSAKPAHRVLVVSGRQSAASISSESYFLEAALRLAEVGDSYAESPFAPTIVAYADDTGLPSLSGFDAIVLANVANVSAPDATRLASFVQGGGGLLVFTGDSISARTCSTLANAGLTVGEIGETKTALGLPWRLQQWDEKHAVFEPLSDPQHGDLRRLVFSAYTKLTAAPDAIVLAQFNTGDPAVLERHSGDGTILWVATSCGREWSDWCRSRLFLPTVHQLLSYEVGLSAGGAVRTTADKARSQSSEQHAPGVEQFKRYAEVINTNPRESEPDRCTRQEFEDRFALKFVDDGDSPAIQSTMIGNVEFHHDELWHWVACALLAVLMLEGFVGNRTTA